MYDYPAPEKHIVREYAKVRLNSYLEFKLRYQKPEIVFN